MKKEYKHNTIKSYQKQEKRAREEEREREITKTATEE